MRSCVVAVLFFYFMGANSAPHHSSRCPKASCRQAINAIIDNLNHSKISSWNTHARNESEESFVNCNLKIFIADFNRQWKKGNCSEYKNMNLHECLVYKGLECIPHNCQVPSTVCTDPPNLSKRNFRLILKSFVTTVQRMQI